jgi:ABC-2 type transport system permease protein
VSLFRTELRRLAKRRFARWTTAGGLLVLALVVVGMFFSNQKIGADQWAEARRSADQQHQEQVRWAEQERANCERAKAAGETVDYYPADCAEIVPPSREEIEEEWFLPSTFNFRESFAELLIPLASWSVPPSSVPSGTPAA